MALGPDPARLQRVADRVTQPAEYLRRTLDSQAGPSWGGLFFIAFMKNPAQFIRLQQALAADALNEYIHHTGSAVFVCPPGIRPGQHWGDGLFT